MHHHLRTLLLLLSVWALALPAAAVTWNVGNASGSGINVLTTTGTLGSSNNFPIEIWTNNQRVFRVGSASTGGPNLILGYAGNAMGAPSPAIIDTATISGGGKAAQVNRVTDSGCTISGGAWNTCGNGDADAGNASYSVVAGGSSNTVAGPYSSILGGQSNVIDYPVILSTIAGGTGNHIGGNGISMIGGGSANTILADNAFILAGFQNTITATGHQSIVSGTHAVADHRGCWMWSDDSSVPTLGIPTCGQDYSFVVKASGGTTFFSNNAMTAGVKLNAGSGSWASVSDRNVKRDFEPVDTEAVLAKVTALPISTWAYQTESGVRHMGPMAQDFRGAFGLGVDDKSIVGVDADGVALAAIQGLAARVERLERENAALRRPALPIGGTLPVLGFAALAGGLGIVIGRRKR